MRNEQRSWIDKKQRRHRNQRVSRKANDRLVKDVRNKKSFGRLIGKSRMFNNQFIKNHQKAIGIK